MRTFGRQMVLAGPRGFCALGLLLAWFAMGCDQEPRPAEDAAAPTSSLEEVGQPLPTSDDGAGSVAPPVAADESRDKPAATTRPSVAEHEATGPSSGGESVGSAVVVFEPLADAHVGEWVRLSALNSQEIHYEVTRAGVVSVDIRVTAFMDGRPLGLPAGREELRDHDPVAAAVGGQRAERAARPAVIDAAGRSWEATLYEDRWTEEDIRYLRRTWVSLEAPVFGIVRMEQHGDDRLEARLELKAFGGLPAK